MGQEITSYEINGDDKSLIAEFCKLYQVALTKEQYEELFQVVDRIAKDAYNKGKRK